MSGEIDLSPTGVVSLLAENTRLRADNERLRGERDEANLFRERNRVALNRRDADLQAHKAALEKARDVIQGLRERWLQVLRNSHKNGVSDALSTINELLQKGSK